MASNILIDDDFTLEVEEEEEEDDDGIHEENLKIKTEPDWQIEDMEFETDDVTNIKQEIEFEEHFLTVDKYVDLLEIKTEIEEQFENDALHHFENIPSITETSLAENVKDFASDQENTSLTKNEEIPVAVEPSTNKRSNLLPEDTEKSSPIESLPTERQEIPVAVEPSTNERSNLLPEDTEKSSPIETWPTKNQEFPVAVEPSTIERSNNFFPQDTEKRNGSDKTMQTVEVSVTEKESIAKDQCTINRVYREAGQDNQKLVAQSRNPLDRRRKKILNNLSKNSHQLKEVPLHSFNKQKERNNPKKTRNPYSHILKYNKKNHERIHQSKKFVKNNFHVPFSVSRSNQRGVSSNVNTYKSFNQFQSPLMTRQPFCNNVSVPNRWLFQQDNSCRPAVNYRSLPSVGSKRKYPWSSWGDELKNRPQVWQNQAPVNYSITSQVETFITILQVFNQLNNILVAQTQQNSMSCMTNIKLEMSFLNKFRYD